MASWRSCLHRARVFDPGFPVLGSGSSGDIRFSVFFTLFSWGGCPDNSPLGFDVAPAEWNGIIILLSFGGI